MPTGSEPTFLLKSERAHSEALCTPAEAIAERYGRKHKQEFGKEGTNQKEAADMPVQQEQSARTTRPNDNSEGYGEELVLQLQWANHGCVTLATEPKILPP